MCQCSPRAALRIVQLVAPNSTAYNAPEVAGLPMGTPASQYLSLELHYNNPEGIKGEPGLCVLPVQQYATRVEALQCAMNTTAMRSSLPCVGCKQRRSGLGASRCINHHQNIVRAHMRPLQAPTPPLSSCCSIACRPEGQGQWAARVLHRQAARARHWPHHAAAASAQHPSRHARAQVKRQRLPWRMHRQVSHTAEMP